ncbi:MAG TPA: methylenetetrahydrofolate reductase, partial [bacterium]|nr:methylenetetrahydrofolate reductase [bacterium]
ALKDKIEPIKDNKDKVAQAGIEYAVDQCAELLLKGAPGIHFYVMNKSYSVREVIKRLNANGIVFT